MMNVLVLGGTGAIGYHLVRQLVAGGVNCVVTSRKKRPSESNLTYAQGNAHDIIFIQQLLGTRKWDAIVDFMTYPTEEFMLRYQLLLRATRQYIYLSSSRVYAECDGKINENSPRLLDVCEEEKYLSTDEYALRKARQEDILKNSGYHHWTIIRPYVTFSEQRLQLSPLEKEYWLYRALHGRTIVFSKDLAEKTTTLTYGEDVARGIASLIGKESALGKAFHITTSETHQWSEILMAYLDVLEKKSGTRPKLLLTDKWESYYVGNVFQVKYDRMYNRKFDNSRINDFIDTTTFKHTIPTLMECLSEFLDNPSFKPINWRKEARKDRLTGEWAHQSEIQGVKHKIIYLLNRLGLKI